MDTCFPDWNTDPIATHRNPLGPEDELVELLWQDGEVVLNTQTSNRKQQSKQAHKHYYDQSNQNTLIQDYETVSWADCPIDEAFEKEFFANILSEIPPAEPSSEVKNDGNLQLPVKGQKVVDMGTSLASSSYGVGRNVSPLQQNIAEKEKIKQAFTPCSGGSRSSGFLNQSNETDNRKRKNRDAEESECRSDATELESVAGNKSSQKHGMARKSRVAEVHNMSERRRRDRINERMKALQELIPHSNKSDKASMLDEAIEYMKSLQWQLQMMWMGSGMTPMMVPSMQHYMSRFRMGMGPPMLPAIPNSVCLSRLPLVGQGINMDPRTNQAFVNYHNHMQNYMGFLHSAPNSSQVNSFNYGIHSAQQNMVLTPPDKANGPHGS